MAAQIVDEFSYVDNAALEAVWGAPVVGGQTGTSFTYNTGSGTLNATELADSDVGGYATATFTRPVAHSGNFLASMDFNWNQSVTLGVLFYEIRGASGVIASGGLGDDTGSPGHAYMQVGGQATYLGPNGAYLGTSFEAQSGATATSFNNAPIVSGAADAIRAGYSLGNAGTATFSVARVGDQFRLNVSDGTKSLSMGPITGSTEDVTSLNIVYGGFAFGGPVNVLTGDTGTHVAVERVSLKPFSGAPGDANGVGGVDIDDYLLIQANAFTTVPFATNGDVTYDGFVDFSDFRLWKENYPGGAVAAEAAIAALGVPEPSSLVLTTLGLVTMGVLVRRRRAGGR